MAAYCGKCRFLENWSEYHQCFAPENLGTWFSASEPRKKAYEINQNNECTWFQPEIPKAKKTSWWWRLWDRLDDE